jgi:outer membrane protein assembly factor BamB
MSILSKKALKPILLTGLVLFSASLMSGCSGSAVAASSWPGLTVGETSAFVAYNQAVYAIDIANNKELWRFPEKVDRAITFFAPPAVSDQNLVIVGGYDKMVYALDMQNGDLAWPQPFAQAEDRIIGSPVIAGEIVLVPSADGRLYALDLTSGEPVWQEPFQAMEVPDPLWSAPVVDDKHVYLASLDHHVYALELSTGDEIWRRDLSSAIADSPTLVNGLLLVGTFGEQLIALDVENGQTVWSTDTDGWVWGNPVASDEAAYFGDVSGMIYAVDPNNGRELWRKQLDGSVAATPALGNEGVYFVTESGTVNAFSTSGETMWANEVKLNSKLLSDPILNGDKLLIATMDPECLIFEIDALSGAIRCMFQPET